MRSPSSPLRERGFGRSGEMGSLGFVLPLRRQCLAHSVTTSATMSA
jgi:hypothetical protein